MNEVQQFLTMSGANMSAYTEYQNNCGANRSQVEWTCTPKVHREMQGLWARMSENLLISAGPHIWPDPYADAVLETTLSGLVDGVKGLEKASGKRLLTLLATIALEEAMDKPLEKTSKKRRR
jgi:hypothetical protein